MAPIVETKISSPNTVIKIVTGMTKSESNSSDQVNEDCKESEKNDRDHKESSSTQTSSSSSLLHKRKSHCFYVSGSLYRPSNNYAYALFNRPKRSTNTTTQKIISAKFLRVKQLQSELTEAQKKINDLQEENRTLRNIQKRQDSALKKYECQESHLPQLMKSHEEELRVLSSKYKKLRSAYNELESRHNKQCLELNNMKDRHKHLLKISQDKHLLQREQLTKQIEEMKTVINDLKNKVKLQSRRLDLEAKNFKYQLSIECQKQKVLQEQLKQSQDTIHKLELEIKDKERYMANCKINQHIINKMSHLRLKMPSNSGKSVSRICSNYEENAQYNEIRSDGKQFNENMSSNDSTVKETSFNNPSYDSDDDLVSKPNLNNNTNEETGRKPYSFAKSLPSINQNNFGGYADDSKSNSSGTKSPFSSYFDLNYSEKSKTVPKVEQFESNNKSDSDNNNNNVKRQSPFNDGVQSESEKLEVEKASTVLFKDTVVNNNENNVDALFPKDSNFDDNHSEKSDDMKTIDETISWLEFHEKFNHRNESMKKKSDKPLESKNNTETKPKPDSLPFDKKSALLSALREIDLENTEKSPSKIQSPKFSQNKTKLDIKIVKNSKQEVSIKSFKTSSYSSK